MALFEKQLTTIAGSRSNTKLVVSGGDSPAEKWVTDSTLPVLFNYDYAAYAERQVVIAKGLIVAVGGKQKDYDTGAIVNSITIADGAATDNKKFAIGMAPYNFSKNYADFLYGNQPAIITREYVELPLFVGASAATDAATIKYGAVFGSAISAGDYVKIGSGANKGQLTKWVAGTDGAHLIVGQVLATDENQEPFGWLKWAQYPEELVEMLTKGGTKGAGPGENGWPFDAEYQKGLLGAQGTPGFNSPYTTDPTGMPGILDGSQKAQTVHTVTDTVPAGYSGTPYTISLGYKNVIADTFVVEVDGNATTGYTVDEANGKLTITSANAGEEVSVNFRANFYGTPAGWDYKGSVGVARVLLKF